MDRPYRPDRDHHRDRDRDRDNYRNRDRDFRRQSRRPSAFSDAPPPDHNQFPRSHNSPPHRPRPDHGNSPHGRYPGSGPINLPPDYRGGFSSGDYRPGPGNPPEDLWPMRGSGVGFGNDFPPQRPPFHQLPIPQSSPPQLSGQKRGFSDRGGSPEQYDGRNLVKLFIGSVPRTVTEEEVRPCFEEHGKVLEVALIKDKRSGQQQGCCFIKYATTEEADRAIRALHNQYTLPGGVGPIQVRYADGERERLGNVAVEHKLYVGSLNKYSTEKEVEEIFLPYGRIDDVYLLRDERKQSKGCGFVKYASKDSAVAAANALHGIYTMRGCNQPLIVRFAEPKKLRPAEPRAGSAFEGPGPGPSPSPGFRLVPGSSLPDAKSNQRPLNAWQPLNPLSSGPSPNTDVHGFGNGFPSRPGEAPMSSIVGGYTGVQGGIGEGSFPPPVSASSTSSQNLNQSYPQAPSSGQQISPLQSSFQPPLQFPPALQLHQRPGSYGQAPTSQPPPRPHSQLISGTMASYSQPFQSHQFQSLPGGQLPSDQFQVQQNAAPVTTQPQPNTSSSLSKSQLATPVPQQTAYQQSPSQLAQMLSQQTHSLQASFQSSQQTLSHLQQQLQMMQPSTQNQPSRQSFQASEKQSQWAGAAPTATTNAHVGPTRDAPPPTPLAPAKCNWTEHTSPDGYKYYYNSATGESKWEKPDELKLYEQQHKSVAQQTQPQAQHNRQDISNQKIAQTQPSQLQMQFFVEQHRSAAQQIQPQAQHNRQDISNQQVAQTQPSQLQTQFRSADHLQHPPLLSNYPASLGPGNQTAQDKTYSQSLAPANSVTGPAAFQQGFPAAQDWAWNNSRGN